MTQKKYNVIVVGNGLFGCMAAKAATAEGHHVIMISYDRKLRASPASGCVIAPSWVTWMPKSEYENALALLHAHYGLQDLEFPLFKAKRVNTDAVLRAPDVVGMVTAITPGAVAVRTPGAGGVESRTYRGKVLVAAGMWCEELIKDLPPQQPRYGAALRARGQLPAPVIQTYLPYRQAVGFNISKKEVWFGDGTAVSLNTWEPSEQDRIDKTVARAKSMGVPVSSVRTYVGARPYMKSHKHGFFEKVMHDVWVSTGGAKNGTVLAMLQAQKFVKALV